MTSPMRGGLRALLFDWDGTLADSAAASFRCYSRLFDAFGISFDQERFEQTYSPNWYRTYAAVGLPEDRWAEADTLWLKHYALDKSCLVSGAKEALTRVRDAGLVLGLVTSGSRERVARDLTSMEVSGFFRTVVCGEDTQRPKPHPDALVLALGRLGVDGSQAAYVGDSPEDIEMARAAGVYAVGIPGGFPNREALRLARPDLLATSLDDALNGLLA
jgi:HAD superfamily hydrolase (TIGR01509 family)